MSSPIIKARTIGGLPDNAVQLNNGLFARKISIPPGWSQLRVGIRLQANTGAGVNDHTALFAFGLSAGTANVFGDANTANFAGIWLKDGIDNNGGANWVFQVYAATKVGSTLTNTTSFSGTGTFGNGADTPSAARTVMFVDITKGSPNYTFNLFINTSNGTPADITHATWLTLMQAATPSSTGCTYTGAKTLAVDEATNGVFDSVNVYWPTTTTNMEIYDIGVVQLA